MHSHAHLAGCYFMHLQMLFYSNEHVDITSMGPPFLVLSLLYLFLYLFELLIICDPDTDFFLCCQKSTFERINKFKQMSEFAPKLLTNRDVHTIQTSR